MTEIARTAQEDLDGIAIRSDNRYMRGLMDAMDRLGQDELVGPKRIDQAFGVNGYTFKYKSHRIFWDRLQDGTPRVFAVLHEKMDHKTRLREVARDLDLE